MDTFRREDQEAMEGIADFDETFGGSQWGASAKVLSFAQPTSSTNGFGADSTDSSSQASSTQTSTITWINWYTSLPGHDYFCEVLEDFIEDDFNLTGLQSMVPFWKEALEMVLDVEPEEDTSKIPDVTIVENSAELLFGLVHQRFILTKPGLAAMLEKYEQGHFGACPRVFCHATHVLPCGRADMPGVDTVKLYCPNCGDIYTPPSSKYTGIDGAFFGTTFSPLFFQTYPELLSAPFCPQVPNSTAPLPPASGLDSREPSPSPSVSFRPGGETHTNPDPNGGQKSALGKVYDARIYGFRVSERARSGPRMRWLRERPVAWNELDTVDHRGRWIKNGGEAAGQAVKEQEEVKEKGRLFDDDDDIKEEDGAEEEEEEEEDKKMEAAPAAEAPRKAPPVPASRVQKPKEGGSKGSAGGSKAGGSR